MPYRVQRDQVAHLDVDAVAKTAACALALRNLIYENAYTLHDSIVSLDWTGQANKAACDRAEREYGEMCGPADAYEDLHDACLGIHDRMGPLVAELQRYRAHATGHPERGIGISRDWTVTMADADEAEADTRRLQSCADELGRLDEQYGAAIEAANRKLAAWVPVQAALSAGRTEQDVEDYRTRHPNPVEPARLQAATALTEQQRRDLADGKPISIAQDRFDYLNDLMRSRDGVSVAGLAALGADLPQEQQKSFRSAFADGMQLISNPQVRAAGVNGTPSGDVGGMRRLPEKVRTLLTESPVCAAGEVIDPKTRVPGSIRREGDLRTMTTVIGRGDPGFGQGSDLDRGMLKQASEIAGATAGSSSHHQLIDSMVSSVAGDGQAVHDFVVGRNMDVTCDHSGNYNPNDHTTALLTYPWTSSDHGVVRMVNEIPGDVDSTDPGAVERGLDTAGGLDHALGTPGLDSGTHLAIANAVLAYTDTPRLPGVLDAMPSLEPHPTTRMVPDASKIRWAPMPGPLFDAYAVPSMEDVNQGEAGDCYVMSALAGIADKDPTYIRSHVHDNHNHTYAVDLYDGHGNPQSITVSDRLPTVNGHVVYTQGQGVDGRSDPTGWPGGTPQWAAIYEKALAEQRGSYAAIDRGGHSNTGIGELTGRNVDNPNPGGPLNSLNAFLPGISGPGGEAISDIRRRLDDNDVIVTGTVASPDNPSVEGAHDYTVVAADTERGTITVRNPWGAGTAEPEYVTLTKDQWDDDFEEWSGVKLQ